MSYGICTLNSVALRKEPSNRSEMVSQILFGETFVITESEDHWLKIISDFDSYEAWVHKEQIVFINSDIYSKITANNSTVSNEFITFISNKNNDLQTITMGSSLPLFKKNTFKFSDHIYEFEGKINSSKLSKNKLIRTAYLLLNTPFLWGGRTPLGLDCSGFIQLVYKINGYKLFRDSVQQVTQGEVLSFIEESEPGDLAFFDNEEGEIVHVGIILADHHIIHCHEKVRIDRLDQSGIYNIDRKRHTHKLRVLKQIFKGDY